METIFAFLLQASAGIVLFYIVFAKLVVWFNPKRAFMFNAEFENHAERVYANMPEEKIPNMINADFYIWDWLQTFMQPVSINCKSIEDNYYEQITDLKKIHITDLFKK